MEILKIRFRNINSLKGLHEVDLSTPPLAGSGIFAITGPTGSGKTTILDVISLALYNRVPRVTQSITKGLIEKTGLIVTHNMGEAMAEVTYACPTGIYTSRWGISSTRNKNFRDYTLELFDENGNPQNIKKGEVPNRNTELVGLNYDQFVKAMLLAQGDFSTFLKANPDERGALLEKITNTGIYRMLGKAAFLKNKEQTEALEHLTDQAKSYEQNLLEPAQFKKLEEDINKLREELDKLNERIAWIQKQKSLKSDITTIETTIEDLSKQLNKHQAELKAFLDQHGQAMKKHRELIPYSRNFWDWQQLTDSIDQETNRLLTIEKELKQYRDDNTRIKQEVKTLTKSDSEVEEALDVFRKEVLHLQNQRNQAQVLRDNARQELQKELHQAGIPMKVTDADSAKTFLLQKLEQNQLEIKNLETQLSEEDRFDPQASIKAVKERLEAAQNLVNIEKDLSKKNKELKINQNTLAELQQEVDTLPNKIEKAQKEQNYSEQILKTLQKDRTTRDLSLSFESHRSRLIPGEPCPLCGSTEHPYSEGLPARDDELDKKISKAESENEQKKEDLNNLNFELEYKKTELAKVRSEVMRLTDEIKLLEDELQNIVSGLPSQLQHKKPELLLNDLKHQSVVLEKFHEIRENGKKLQEFVRKASNWEKHSLDFSTLRKQCNDIFSGDDVVLETNKLFRRYNNNNQKIRDLGEETKKLQQSKADHKLKLKELDHHILSKLPAYSSVKSAMENFMDETKFDKLEKQENEINGEIKSLSEKLKFHNENLLEKQKKDVDNTMAELQEEHGKLLVYRDEQQSQRDDLAGKFNFQNRTRDQLSKVKKQIEELHHQNEKWRLLKNYIGDAEGKRFSTFAQELTLYQLTQLANHHLKMLNDRFQLNIPSSEEDKALVVVDTHMGNVRRSVKSLSGGESFLVSLSLALALSDLAAYKVKIGSLFIDEGFGSLDKLTLDQTIDTLEKLQYASKKTIAVISHVEAMQERITTQIRLEKTGQGHSKLKIVQA